MIRPSDFLDLADALARGVLEAEWRTAVSRAYYGAFHEARELLLALRFRVPRAAQAHAYLWLRLSNTGDAQVNLAGSELSALHGERNRADYDSHQTVARAEAQRAAAIGRQVVHWLTQARVEPLRSQ